MKKILIGFFVFGLLFVGVAKSADASFFNNLKQEIKNLKTQIFNLKSRQGASALSATGDTTPRIMYWSGMVNQHVDSSGEWQTDPNGWSGADENKLSYCKKWYPSTIDVEQYKSETIDTWRAGGNEGAYTGTAMSYKCIQNPYATGVIPAFPTVVFPSASPSQTSVVLKASVPNPISPILERGFYYGTSMENMNNKVVSYGTISEIDEYTASVSGLTADTKYYYKGYATNGLGNGYSIIKEFTTLSTDSTLTPIPGGWSDWVDAGLCSGGYKFQTRACNNPTPANGGALCTGVNSRTISCDPSPTIPTLISQTSYGVTQSTATLEVNLFSAGFPSSISERGFYYGTTTNPTTKVTSTGTTTGIYAQSLSNLTPGTKYYYKAFATNGTGTAYSSVGEFTTLAGPNNSVPTLGFTTLELLSQNAATIGAAIISPGIYLGIPASIYERGFYYGTSDTSQPTKVVVTGTTTGTYTKSLAGLTPGTKYYWKGYATNGAGTGYTNVLNFTTTPSSVAIPGGWSDWVNSGSCVGGQQVQTRLCNNPEPANGGAFCSGSSTRTISCGSPVSGTLTGSGCDIPIGGNSCPTTISWAVTGTTTNLLVKVESVGTTTPIYQNYNKVSSKSVNLLFGATTFKLHYGPDQLDQKIIEAKCIEGSTWSSIPGTLRFECKANSNDSIPTISSLTATSVGQTVTLGASVSSSSSISERGFYYGTTPNPTTKVIATGTATGPYTYSLTGLTPGTTYYFKGYAKNAIGVGETSVKDFKILAQTPTPDTLSGTLTNSDCEIPLGQNYCSTTLTWGITGADNNLLVKIQQSPSNNIVHSGYQKSGSKLINYLVEGNTTFSLFYGNSKVAEKVINAHCPSGAIRTGLSGKCTASSTTPSITVLSPNNGGEIYQEGQQITVKWKSENLPTNAKVAIYLDEMPVTGVFTQSRIGLHEGMLVNDGIEEIILTPRALPHRYGKYFKIAVVYYKNSTIIDTIEDVSDNYFTIKKSITEDGCLHGEIYSSTTGQPCANTQSSITITSQNTAETLKQGESKTISWTGGSNRVQIGLVKSNFVGSNNNSGILGWVELNGQPNGSVSWDGTTLKNIYGGPSTFIVVPGEYKFVAVTRSSNGNYCTGPNSIDCSYDLSNGVVTITNTAPATDSLSVTPSTCVVEKNKTHCLLTLIWSTPNPVGVSKVMIDGYPSVFAIGNSGSSTIMVSPAGATYRLFNNGVEIGREYVSSTCIQGTNWWGRCAESEIISNISIIFPENNKTYKAGRDINLKWNSVNPYFGNIKIKISKEGVLVKEITTADDQQETIVIPITAPAGQYKLEIGYDSQTEAIEYTSSINFSVNNNVFTQKLGMGYITKGGEVVALQTLLKDEGYITAAIDGKFGRGTRAAVISFQMANGLEADGIIGGETRALLNTKWKAKYSSWN